MKLPDEEWRRRQRARQQSDDLYAAAFLAGVCLFGLLTWSM